jgi:hypothetical protein
MPAGRPTPKILTTNTIGGVPAPRTVAPEDLSLVVEGAIDLGGEIVMNGVPLVPNVGGLAYGNTALGLNALVSITPGQPSGTHGIKNSAFGGSAIQSNTQGSLNTGVGYKALYTVNTGDKNTAVGVEALHDNLSADLNVAIGYRALASQQSGFSNTALGSRALQTNTEGQFNTAVGYRAMAFDTSYGRGTATGSWALYSNTTGYKNTADGVLSMMNNTTGSYNVAMGYYAGGKWTTGDYNIAIGYGSYGTAAESGTIRIGGEDFQSRTFIEGIRGATGTFDEAVCTSAGEQLGPCTPSSRRFKEAIETMGETVSLVSALRPVTFRYLPGEEDEAVQPKQYGLIAEEVAEVLPTLVSYDDQGRPSTVRYSLLTPLLLNQVQRQEEELTRLRAQMAERDQRLADLRRQLEALAKKKRFR